MVFIITKLVFICLGASGRTPPGARISRCIEDLLVTFCCCLLYGRVVVSLAHSPFSFSILLKVLAVFQFKMCLPLYTGIDVLYLYCICCVKDVILYNL